MTVRGKWGICALALVAGACGSAARVQPAVAPAADFAAGAADLTALIEAEMADKRIPGLSIAVLDGDEVVWASGFGWADPDARVPARADTVYRVGSVSKLFTDVAAMQLVEAERLDLDAPVTDYLPSFRPHNPYGKRITTRQLMTHHSGLVREPPVGHYFDASGADLRSCVDSLNRTEVVFAPGSVFKYSNAGVAAAGLVVQEVAGQDFAAVARDAIVAPLGLRRTSFTPEPHLDPHRAVGFMWAYDRPEFAAPTFELGMVPAANLYSSVTDLVRFARSWFVGEARCEPHLLDESTMRSMFEPQLASRGTGRMGLGFFLGEVDGHLRVGHGGAMYGFATELAALPERGLAVAVVANVDFANAVPERIADRALRWLLARQTGAEPSPFQRSEPVDPELRSALVGSWQNGRNRVRLYESGGELWAQRSWGARLQLRRQGDELISDGRVSRGLQVGVGEDELVWGRRRLQRVDEGQPEPPPAAWRELIGEYGWDHNVLYVLERHGELCVLIEWLIEYPLQGRGDDRFRLPDSGLYAGEAVVFERDAQGAVAAVTVGGVRFPRRVAPGAGGIFRITPTLPRDELRARALAADPPVERGYRRRPDLVEPRDLDKSIQLDIRYATNDNFLGMAVYPEPVALLQRPAAEALARAHRSLQRLGYGIVVYDAYRPWFVTKMFHEGTPEDLRIFVADPEQGSRHNRGCAVDVTLYDTITGEHVPMVSGYDEFTPRAFPEYPGGSTLERWYRDLLRRAMEAEGFSVYDHEWWHFDYRAWEEYPILNAPFL